MSKRNIRAKSGKQLYLNSSFIKGMVYTSSEIPEGYTRLLNNFDITPSGDAISPRAPFKEIKNDTQGLSKYTYPITFQQFPNKQFYINFPYTVNEKDFYEDVLRNDYDTIVNNAQINIFSRDNNMLNNPSLGFDQTENVAHSKDNYVLLENQSYMVILKDYVSSVLYKTYPYINLPVIEDEFDDYYTINTYSVTDADTLLLNGTKYRLININAPEKNHKWYRYGKSVLEQLVAIADKFHVETYGKDIYERIIADIILSIEQYNISLSQAIIRLGLAKIDYIDETYPYMDNLRLAEEQAASENLRIWDIYGVDVMYNGNAVDLVFTNVEEGNYVLEVVKTTYDKQINYTTSNIIDKVEYQYIDYNDSIAFIGRVTKDSTIYYKGLIYLKFNSDSNRFEIELPPNNLNGEEVRVLDITSNGYNLLNKETINTNDYVNSSIPLSCDGIAITLANDPTTLVQQAKDGDTVTLRAIMNRSWYPTPKYGDIEDIEIKIRSSISYKENNSTKYTGYNEELLSDYNELYRITIDESTTDITDISLQISNITISYKYKNRVYNINTPVNRAYDIFTNNTSSTPIYDLSEIISEINGTITFSYAQDTGIRYVYASLSDVSITPTEVKPIIQGQWEVSPYGTESTKVLVEYTKICDVDGEVPDTWLDVNTLEYTVYGSSNLTFIFKYKLYYEYKVGNDYLETVDDTNYTSVVYPLLQVGPISKHINHEELTKNLNIKDATRLGVFNRQVFVYGPYLRTNTIFFSKFENPWYFSYPYYAIDTEDKIIHAVTWNSNLTIFQKNSIWVLVTEGTVNESTLHKVYDELSIADTDRRLVKTVGSNLVFFNNNNGYIMTSSKYYSDPTNVNVYKFTDNINNCLTNPTYLFRTIRDIPIQVPTNHITCEYSLYIDNDFINLISYVKSNNGSDIYSTTIIYRYNQLYKNWTTYSVNKYLLSAYTAEPNINNQYVTYDGSKFGIAYQDFNEIDRTSVECTIDTGFLSIDPLNDKRFKDVILDFNNIINHKEDRNIIDIFHNFFIDGIPQTMSGGIPNVDFDYEVPDALNYMSYAPTYNEGDYSFKFVEEVDEYDTSEHPFGYNIHAWSDMIAFPDSNADNTTSVEKEPSKKDYDIKVQGRSQIRMPVFGKGRLPSMAIKLKSKYPYDIVGYSIIYKEKNINRRR